MTSGYLQEEPDAGKPPVRICEGKSRMAELLDRRQNWRIAVLQDKPRGNLLTAWVASGIKVA
jgi:hypothetical protein